MPQKKAPKCQVPWDWKKGALIPAKKQKSLATNKNVKSSEKYVCIKCLELSLRGERDEKFASLCRSDSSSVNRHKERWHKGEESRSCTIVPSSAPEVQSMQKDCHKSKTLIYQNSWRKIQALDTSTRLLLNLLMSMKSQIVAIR